MEPQRHLSWQDPYLKGEGGGPTSPICFSLPHKREHGTQFEGGGDANASHLEVLSRLVRFLGRNFAEGKQYIRPKGVPSYYKDRSDDSDDSHNLFLCIYIYIYV